MSLIALPSKAAPVIKKSSALNLGRVICSLSAITIIAKIFGFAEKIVIAHFFGTSDKADIYFALTTILLSLVFLIKELIYPILLPVLSQAHQETPRLARHIFKQTFLTTALILVILALIVVAFSSHLTGWLVPGFSSANQQTTADLLRWLAPAFLGLGLMTVTATALNAHRKFLSAIFGELAVKVVLVAGLLLLLPFLKINAFPPILLVGGLAGLLIHFCFLPERSCLLRRTRGDNQPILKMLRLMAPLIVGVVISHISGLFDNMLASTLPAGRLACLNYAKKITDALLLIGPVAMVTVIYSQIAHLAARRDDLALSRLIISATRILLYISVPLSCLLIFLCQPILQCLFQHGSFTASSTHQTAAVLLIYALGLTTFAIDSLLVYSFFALSDTQTPVVWGILCVLLDILLAWLWLPYWGELGIAGALVLSKIIKIIILAYRLQKKLPGLWHNDIIMFVVKLFLAAVLLASVLEVTTLGTLHTSLLTSFVFDLIWPTTAGLIVFLLASIFLRIEEARWFLSSLVKQTTRLASRRFLP